MKAWGALLLRFFGGYARDQKGVSALIFALSLTGLTGMSAFAVDIGHVYVVKRLIQASTDASALAGAASINCCSTSQAVAAAVTYSSGAGGKNPIKSATVTMSSGYPKLICLNSVKASGVPCDGVDTANAITVKQQATIPMWFAQVVGITSFQVSAIATAGSKGGLGKAIDVMVVVDTTASMAQSDSSCSIAGATKLVCAQAGVRALLTSMSASSGTAGMIIFPGLINQSQVPYEYDCNSSTPTSAGIAPYAASPVYQIIPLSNDFKVGASTTLNTSSNLVIANKGGVSGCQQGMTALGGVNTFYADAITAAQNALTTNGRANTQKVIVLLSDGDAAAPATVTINGKTVTDMPASKLNNQCTQAVTAAQAATAAGTWVYSIAYNTGTGGCSTDKGAYAITACAAMQAIASDANKFYSDAAGGAGSCNSSAHSISELVSVFANIGTSLQSPRLLPDNTT